MGFKDQGLKPHGRIGTIIGRMMNRYHTRYYRKYYGSALPPGPKNFLDLGCGGGKFIKYLWRNNGGHKLYGLDHSPEMVKLSQKVNRRAIKKGHAEIALGSVTDLPYEAGSMDLVTAHETVQFWPNIHKSFTETHRVLKPGGSFIIINRYPQKGSKWYDTAKLKNDLAFRNAFEKAGFSEIQTDLNTRKGWIIAKGAK